jgi:hypothetical protein
MGAGSDSSGAQPHPTKNTGHGGRSASEAGSVHQQASRTPWEYKKKYDPAFGEIPSSWFPLIFAFKSSRGDKVESQNLKTKY